jgi:vacuolar-type H+-ATPase subunit H
MTTAASSANELETLARLREDELALDRRLETARQDAETRLAAAHREAARLEAQAEADLREELASLGRERARELDATLAAAREETARRLTALRRQAEANREATLAFLLGTVAGSKTP